MKTKTFHIYLNDRCLFKDLNEKEFNVIWGRIYHSYWDGLTYEEILFDSEVLADASY
tara:strand:+ start:318 stop:488 length:171 start_codon:yes stop_codon:yes gene_type:complete